MNRGIQYIFHIAQFIYALYYFLESVHCRVYVRVSIQYQDVCYLYNYTLRELKNTVKMYAIPVHLILKRPILICHILYLAMYLVVEFIDSNDVAIIPSTWKISLYEAWWPPYHSSTRIYTATRNKEIPKEGWSKYSIKIMYESGMCVWFYVLYLCIFYYQYFCFF